MTQFKVLSDNVAGIAEYAVGKYEFMHDVTFDEARRAEITDAVVAVLLARAEKAATTGSGILKELFDAAEEAYDRFAGD